MIEQDIQFDIVYFPPILTKRMLPFTTSDKDTKQKCVFDHFLVQDYLKSVKCFNLFVQLTSCSKTQIFCLDIPRRPIVLFPILTIDLCSPVVTMTRMGAEGPQRWPTPCRTAESIRWPFNILFKGNKKEFECVDQLITHSISIRRRRYVVVAALLGQLTIKDIRAILQITYSISLITDHFLQKGIA